MIRMVIRKLGGKNVRAYRTLVRQGSEIDNLFTRAVAIFCWLTPHHRQITGIRKILMKMNQTTRVAVLCWLIRRITCLRENRLRGNLHEVKEIHMDCLSTLPDLCGENYNTSMW